MTKNKRVKGESDESAKLGDAENRETTAIRKGWNQKGGRQIERAMAVHKKRGRGLLLMQRVVSRGPSNGRDKKMENVAVYWSFREIRTYIQRRNTRNCWCQRKRGRKGCLIK